MKRAIPFISVIFLAGVLRLVFLRVIPLRVDGDSSKFALDALEAWKEHWPFFSTGWYGHTNALFYFIGLFIKPFSDPLLGIRLFSVVGGMLGVLATYLLGMDFFNRRVAFWSSFFLAVCPFHLLISRVGTEAVWVTFFAPFSLYLMAQSHFWATVAAGMVVGIAQYIYPSARLLPITSILFLFMAFIWQRSFKKKQLLSLGKNLAFFFLGFLLVYSPMINYYRNHQKEYWARVEIVGIFQSGWLKAETQTQPLYKVLLKKTIDSYKVFWFPIKRGAQFWYFKTPYLDPFPAALFTLGLGEAIWLFRKRYQSSYLLIFFLTSVFFAGVLTVDSPTPSRYAIVLPFLALFCGLGIEKVITIFRDKAIVGGVIIILLALSSYYSYYIHETRETWKYDFNTQIASLAGRYLRKIKQDYQIYFLSSDYLSYGSVPSLRFLLGKEGIDINGPILEETSKIDYSRPYVLIVPIGKKDDLDALQKADPKSFLKTIYNPLDEELFYLLSNFNLY